DGEFYLVLAEAGGGGASSIGGDTQWGIFAQWKCDTAVRPCPAGLLRGGDGNYVGCEDPGTGCRGLCTSCAGNAASQGHWCKPSDPDTCIIQQSNPTHNCGAGTLIACTGTTPSPLPPAP